MATLHYRQQQVGDVEVFYREAGPGDAPVLLLLHGFPTASHMFRDLIPLLADRYRVIAPDLPGFGQTKAPPRERFPYSFDALAEVIGGFVDAIGLERYALYIFDYGAPTGLRLAMKHPERVTAIISQNGNAYVEGFSDQWGAWEAYWRDPSEANREACRASLSPDAIRDWQYGTGSDRALLSPDGYELDIAYMARPGAEEIQLDLILDYRSNLALYPAFQAYFRAHQPPLLAAWGRHDPAFVPAGAFAYTRDLPEAEVHLLDAGHFALETHHEKIAALVRDFLGRTLANPGSDARSAGARPATVPGQRTGVRCMPQPMSTSPFAEPLIRIGETAIARQDDAALDAYFAPNFLFHGPGGDLTYPELKAYFASLRAALSGMTVERAAIIGEGSYLAARTIFSGTFDAVFTAAPGGPLQPNGRQIRWEVMNHFRYDEDGRLAEEWVQYDVRALNEQLRVPARNQADPQGE